MTNGEPAKKSFIGEIGTEELFGGPLGWFGNEMVQTGWGKFPVSKYRGMPTGVLGGKKQVQDKAQPTPEAPSARYPVTPVSQYVSRVPREKKNLGTYLKEGVKKMKNLFKRDGKKDEIAELKQYVNRALTHEEELLGKGYTLNQTVRDKSADLNSILGKLGATYRKLDKIKKDVDNDMPKLDAVKQDDTNAYTGASHAQTKANFEANLPGMETQYKMIRDNAVGAKITAEGLLRELGAMKLHLSAESEKYQNAGNIYEKESKAYGSQKNRTEEDKLGEELTNYYNRRSEHSLDLNLKYEGLVGNFGDTIKKIGTYQTRGKKVIDNLVGLVTAVDSAIGDIQSYRGKR